MNRLLMATLAILTIGTVSFAEEARPEKAPEIRIPIEIDEALLKEKLGDNEQDYTPARVISGKDGKLSLAFEKAETSAQPVFSEDDDRALRGRNGRLVWYKTHVSPPFGVQDPDLYCNRAIQYYTLCRGGLFQVCTEYAVQDAYYDYRSGRCVVAISPRR